MMTPDATISDRRGLLDFGGHPLLTDAERARLFGVLNDPAATDAGRRAARDELAVGNFRLVVFTARRFAGRGLDLEDLVGHGCRGLLRAIDGFDPGRGVKFSVYASHWIKHFVGRAIQDEARSIRVPVYLQKSRGGKPVKTEGGRRRREEARRHIGAAIVERLDIRGEGGGIASGRPGPAEAAEAAEVADILARLGRRHPEEAAVLRLRFGLDGGGARPFREVGWALGISGEQARLIGRRALDRLREEFGGEAA